MFEADAQQAPALLLCRCTAIRFRFSKSLFRILVPPPPSPPPPPLIRALQLQKQSSLHTSPLLQPLLHLLLLGSTVILAVMPRRYLLLLLLTAVFIATLFATADCKKSGRKKSKANHGSVQPGDMSVANSLIERAMKLKQGGAVVPGH